MDKNIKELRAENITFSYNGSERIINNISLTIEAGKITALIGANGSGKSTLFQLFTGRLKPEAGKVYFGGKNICNIKLKDLAKKIAVVHQYNTAPPDITVRKLVEIGRTPYQSGLVYNKNKEGEKAVEEAMLVTNVKKYENRKMSELSGGQKQRVWLAMALAQEPELLLLDEITTYLDIKYQVELLSLIKKLNNDKKLSVLMVLHDINQAMEFADDIVVMKKGQLIAKGNSMDVINEELIEEAFDIETEIIEINNKKHCIFRQKCL